MHSLPFSIKQITIYIKKISKEIDISMLVIVIRDHIE